MVTELNSDTHPNLETNFISGMLLYERTTEEAEPFLSVKMGGNQIAFDCFGPSLKKSIKIAPMQAISLHRGIVLYYCSSKILKDSGWILRSGKAE